MTEPMMTLAEAAHVLNIHRNTANAWVNSGRLRAVKVGRDWRVDPAVLDDVLRPARPVKLLSVLSVSRPRRVEAAAPVRRVRTVRVSASAQLRALDPWRQNGSHTAFDTTT